MLGGGKIRTDAEEERRAQSGEGGRAIFADWRRTPAERAVCAELEKVAAEVGARHITSVAIAWTMQKAPYVFPVLVHAGVVPCPYARHGRRCELGLCDPPLASTRRLSDLSTEMDFKRGIARGRL